MALTATTATALLLSTFATSSAPWLAIEANSDQRQPYYLGATPREMALKTAQGAHAVLRDSMRVLGEKQLDALRHALHATDLQFELWPATDDDGKTTWAIARYRHDKRSDWQWLDAASLQQAGLRNVEPAPFLPQTLRPWRKRDAAQIFDDFLVMDDLYNKPVFGDCAWTTGEGTEISGAWLPVSEREALRAVFTAPAAAGERAVCRVIPQPARFRGEPVTLVVSVHGAKVTWPREIAFESVSEALPELSRHDLQQRIRAWPENFERDYRADVLALDGESDAVFPASGRTSRFVRKNSADPANQLEELVSYLEERYSRLGLQTRRQSFIWRGIKQLNLLVRIPGTASDAAAKPILMADHIDTAFCEDTFAQSRKRVSAPGADDNVTAVATLLRAAEIFRERRPKHDIWLVHLTGEEFPADDLGARAFVSQLLGKKQDIGGLVLMDMIGYRKRSDGLFQVNPGDSPESLRMAAVALEAAHATLGSSSFFPVLRTRFDDRSYLYNTDGLIFSNAGYPVVLFNEHINHLENLNRKGYHQTTDTSAKLDFEYATAVAKVAIETAARLADLEN